MTHSSSQRDEVFDTLSGVFSPPLCLDGSGAGSNDSPQNGTPARYLCPLSAMIAEPAGGSTAPTPVLAVGLLALLWVWVFDGAVLPPLRLWARGRAAAARKDACRCRVCTLRMQARGQPLHDIGARGASSKKALRGWA